MPMFIHLAAFSWQPDVSEEESERLLAGLRTIVDDVSGARQIYAGPNTSERGRGLSHAVLLLADDADAHRTYQQHPNHLAAVSRMDLSQEISESHQPGVVVDLVT
jgi:hypothetical protein